MLVNNLPLKYIPSPITAKEKEQSQNLLAQKCALSKLVLNNVINSYDLATLYVQLS